MLGNYRSLSQASAEGIYVARFICENRVCHTLGACNVQFYGNDVVIKENMMNVNDGTVLANLKKVHLIGIGGISMSAIANILIDRGIEVRIRYI